MSESSEGKQHSENFMGCTVHTKFSPIVHNKKSIHSEWHHFNFSLSFHIIVKLSVLILYCTNLKIC